MLYSTLTPRLIAASGDAPGGKRAPVVGEEGMTADWGQPCQGLHSPSIEHGDLERVALAAAPEGKTNFPFLFSVEKTGSLKYIAIIAKEGYTL